MKSIAFFNNKGGVSKTTSVLNIAYILGEVYKRKVLVVDCDGQQNSTRFLCDTPKENGIEKVLTDTNYETINALSATRYGNIDVITSTTEMNSCTEKFTQLSEAQQSINLEKLKAFWNSRYDYVLIDMPPALNHLTEQILRISDGVIVPVELG